MCGPQCVKPTPAQAHCGACHVTFGGIRGFDVHRRGGVCASPVDLGMVKRWASGVWSWPIDEATRARLVDMRGARG